MKETITTVLTYVAVAIFIFGLIYRWFIWLKTPVPLRIPTTPAPKTTAGILGVLFNEIVFFRSLLRSDLLLWLMSWLFHISIAVTLVGHFFRILQVDLGLMTFPTYIINPESDVMITFYTISVYAGLFVFPVTGLYLLLRRLVNERVRYISILSDYFAILLILLIVITGITVYVANHTTFVQLPGGTGLIEDIHYFAVLFLAAYFPFSKLVHAGSVLVSPTKNQTNTPREKRHINPWNGAVYVDDKVF